MNHHQDAKASCQTDSQDIDNANEYSRAILKLKAAWTGIGMTIGRTLVPDLTRLSVELTVWLIKSREKIAKAAVDAFNDTRVFAKDAFSLIFGSGDAIQTRWLDVAVRKVLDLRTVVADVRRQISLLWEGQDTDSPSHRCRRDTIFVENSASEQLAAAMGSGDPVGTIGSMPTRLKIAMPALREEDLLTRRMSVTCLPPALPKQINLRPDLGG